MANIQDSLKQALKETEAQNDLGRILLMLSSLGNEKLLALEPILESLEKLDYNPDNLKEEYGRHWRYVIGLIADAINAIKMIGKNKMSVWALANFVNSHESLIGAARYLPEPFCYSQAVFGALALIRRARRLRSFDLDGAAINWAEKLGKPASNLSVGELERDFPFLTPVAFRSGIDLTEPTLYKQFFGRTSGLRSFVSPANKKLFYRACKKWPLEDIFAFCPLPLWSADHSGKELWFEKYNWPEQQNELIRLRRMFPGVIVRLATMPELMFLDLSWRLVTGGESPMGIWSFRCKHPDSFDKCLFYGGVDENGAEIKADNYPENVRHPVLPLFILKEREEQK